MNGYYGYPYYTPSASAGFIRGVPYQIPATSGALSFGSRAVPMASGLSSLGSSAAPAVARGGGILSSLANASKGFSFTGLLNGASKTLGVVNQAIPIFYQVRPIWNNAKTMFRVMKEINTTDSDKVIKQKINEAKKDMEPIPEYKKSDISTSNDNSPTFFA